jgi:AraC-like DNA-binding protein
MNRHVAFLGDAHASYEEWPPPRELAPWVAVVWRIRARESFELRVVPDGCMDLIRDDIVGSLTDALTAAFTAGDVAQGIRFHPGGFPALFGVPASELAGLRVSIADVVPGFRSLRRLAENAAPPDPLARLVYGARELRAVVRDSGYSERQLRRRVIAATGHGPKRLMRIARMHEVLRAGRGESWARTAADHGYCDEAHMARDIRELAGATPQALVHGRLLQGGARAAA